MKKLFIILAIACIAKPAIAQKEMVTLDEHNKYIYYQVGDAPGVNADTLYNRCLAGFKKNKHVGAFNFTNTQKPYIEVASKLPVYNSLTIIKHEDADITYTLHAEFKDGKYRYWLTNFIFRPYKRNRYGVYERAQGAELPLEDAVRKIDKNKLDLYLEQIASLGKQIGEEIAVSIKNLKKAGAEPAKIDTRKW